MHDDADSGMGSGGGSLAGTGGSTAAVGGSGGVLARAGAGGAVAGTGGAVAGTGGAVAGGAGVGGSAGAAGLPAAVSFSDIYTGILVTGCSCHNGGAGGLDLATRAGAYANLVGVASASCPSEQRVVPGNAGGSVLYHSLAHTALGTCVVPNMPRGGAALTQAQLEQIAAWIDAGALNN